MFYLHFDVSKKRKPEYVAEDWPLYSDENFWVICWQATEEARIGQCVHIVYDQNIVATATPRGEILVLNTEGKRVDINKVSWIRVRD